MADDFQTIRSVNWRELLPFTNLFRAFRVAVHPSKLVLGLLLIVTFYAGGRILDGVWPKKYKSSDYALENYENFRWESRLDNPLARARDQRAAIVEALTRAEDVEQNDPHAPHGIFDSFFSYEIRQIAATIDAAVALRWTGGADGIRSVAPGVIQSLSNFLIVGPGWLISQHVVFFILLTILFLIVWAIFGGAIARIAAVHVARDEKISVRQALSFSFSKVLSFVFAPVIPIGIILGLGLLLALGGLLFYIPWIGPIVAGVFFPLALVAGFVMTLVALGALGGFDLMYPTVAVEGSDSFDAISRSFSYVFARPWRMLFYTAVALVYGGLCYLFVRYFIFVLLTLTHYFVSWWLGGQARTYYPAIWPHPSIESLIYSPDWSSLKFTESVAAGFICFWVYLVICLLGAFAISFYFSANTIIYYLMRREVDATELDDVYIEELEEEFGETAPIAADAVPATPAAVGTGVSAPAGPAAPATQPAPPASAPDFVPPPPPSDAPPA